MEGGRKTGGFSASAAQKKSITPSFSGGKEDKGAAPINASDDKSKVLKDAEQSASSDVPVDSEDSLDSARAQEEEPREGGYYSGRGKADSGRSTTRAFLKGGLKGAALDKLKKKFPVIGVIVTIFIIMAVAFGAQSLMPFSLSERMLGAFNNMHTSASRRANTLLMYQLGKKHMNPVKAHIFKPDEFKITNRQKENLKLQGIEYDTIDGNDGTKIDVLKKVDSDGTIRIAVADESFIGKINADSNMKVASFADTYRTDSDFRTRYNNGSSIWRGAIANWFGRVTEFFMRGNSISRNVTKDLTDESDPAKAKAELSEAMTKQTGDVVEEGGTRKSAEVDKDEDGNVKMGDEDNPKLKEVDGGKVEVNEEAVSSRRFSALGVKSEADVKTKFEEVTSSYKNFGIDSAGTVAATMGVQVVCTGVSVLGALNSLVTASELTQLVTLSATFLETVDKVKSGEGGVINTWGNALTTSTNDQYPTIVGDGSTVEFNRDNITNNGIKGLGTEIKDSSGSAMEAATVVAMYSGGRANANDPSVNSFNFSKNVNRIARGIGAGVGGVKNCAVAKIGAAAIGAAGGVSQIFKVAACIGGIAAGGIGAAAGCGALAADFVASAGRAVLIGTLISGIIATVLPWATKTLTRDLITKLAGQDLGNAIMMGGNAYMGGVARNNGGTPMTTDSYTQFALARQEVIAEDAELERSRRSPFDITSQYTFLGSIARSLMSWPLSKSVLGTVSAATSTVQSSLVALTPAASAASITESLPSQEEYEETCPYLASIGAVGDEFCMPYVADDISTNDEDPDVVASKIAENFEEDSLDTDEIKIKADSDLAKYITFCSNRFSSFGIADQNIINSLSSWGNLNSDSTFVNTTVNSAIGSVPLVGDIIDFVDNKSVLDNIGYVDGSACVAGNSPEDTGTELGSKDPDWNTTAKYYQRFIEDQSLLESMGVIEESAVARYLDEYYENHPLDNSYEGILARYSGLTKENVIAMLDVFEYYDYIANYDPSERYAFGQDEVRPEQTLLFDNENVVAQYILPNKISYTDVRNRVFVV